MKKFTLSALLMLLGLATAMAQAQFGSIKGRVIDEDSKGGIDYMLIVLLQNGVKVKTTYTNEQGYYEFKNVTPGEYSILFKYVGYQPVQLEGIEAVPDRPTPIDAVSLKKSAKIVEPVVVRVRKPLIKPGGEGGRDIGRETILAFPSRSITSLAGTVGRVFNGPAGTSIGGSRTNAVAYYIDGVRVNNASIPQQAIEQANVITGGTPASLGDFVGGAITSTTRAPSRKVSYGFGALSSSMWQPYHNNLVEGYIRGPIWIKNKNQGDKERVMMGYSLIAQGQFQKDPDPSAIGVWRVKDSVLQRIQDKPLVAAPIGTGYVPAAEFVTMQDLELVKAKDNARRWDANAFGSITFQPKQTINVVLGGKFDYINAKAWSFGNSLFNNINNPLTTRYDGLVYLKFTQSYFAPKREEGKPIPLIASASYTVRVDYQNTFTETQDANHGRNMFDYGYIGKFTTYQMPFYRYYPDDPKNPNTPNKTFIYQGDTISLRNFWEQIGFVDTMYAFEAGNLNPDRAKYTQNYYDMRNGRVSSIDELRLNSGLINGDGPRTVYSMFTNPGSVTTNYSKTSNERFTLFAMGEASVNTREKKGSGEPRKHDLQFGIQYEQQINRSYVLNANGLWGLARQLANGHIAQLDKENPILVNNEGFIDTVKYNRLVNKEAQSTFDKNLREKLIAQGAKDPYGNPIGENSFIDVNSYDPSMYSLNMFSADELLNNGNSYVNYTGYDYLGNRIKGRPGLNDFLNDQRRLVPAYQPIYTAAFIQDMFQFKDIFFRIGLRVERYDLNQSVLKDPFSLFPIKTAGEVKTVGSSTAPITHPGTIGDDYAVYVNDVNNPTSIVGYRNGFQWYNKDGIAINDPTVLATSTTSGRISPYLVNPNQKTITADAFTDYDPKINFLPRISFSFPITNTAQFYANYDVLAQRPENSVAQIDDYYFLQNRAVGVIGNPNLKPQTKTDYELGFKQELVEGISAVSLIATRTEYRDMITQQRVYQAYPLSYTTYANLDFASVKGFRLEYQHTTEHINLNTNYNLQFADGTGSNAGSNAALIAANQPNLRTMFPLDFDVRHIIRTSFVYDFGNGKTYNGPRVKLSRKDDAKAKSIFENAGISVFAQLRSGTPYTAQSIATPEVLSGVATRSNIKGTVNGSRLPWQFTSDLQVYKNFSFKYGKESKKQGLVKVYMLMSNVLNTKNILSVYNYTGSPSDDGYLTSPQGQQAIREATYALSYVSLYSLRMNDPGRYGSPRMARLGVLFSF